VGPGEVELAPGRERATAVLRNTGTLPVWVSSHVPLDHLNPAVQVLFLPAPQAPQAPPASIPRAADGRYRLDVPAGTAVRVDAGAELQVGVVRVGGTS
jgi:urease subunit gamma/beta